MRFVVRRLLALIPILLLVSIAVFLLLHLIPGDPAELVAGPGVSGEDLETIRRNLGLDRPLHIQYLDWLWRVLHGDFGTSIATRQPVFPQVMERFGNTAQLAGVGILLASVAGILAGIGAALKRNSGLDLIIMAIANFGISMPTFWIGLMLVLLFGVTLGWLPAGGKESARFFILPGITIGVNSAAIIARMMRSSLLDVIGQDYMRTARAKGLTPFSELVVHALKNAMIPVVTVITMQFGYLLGGAVLTETVFVWPGLGRLIVDAIFRRDYPVLQAGIMLIATTFLIVNLVADLFCAWLDPRIRLD